MRFTLCAAVCCSLVTATGASAQAAQLATGAGTAQGQAYFEFQVEKPVSARPGNPHAQYPDDLRARARGGEVTCQFVVDTAGHVDMATFEVVKASEPAYAAAVKRVLPAMRYFAAEEGGHKVRQLVEQDFRFAPSE
jgi:outer membrane biosynthesis protein TonB